MTGFLIGALVGLATGVPLGAGWVLRRHTRADEAEIRQAMVDDAPPAHGVEPNGRPVVPIPLDDDPEPPPWMDESGYRPPLPRRPRQVRTLDLDEERPWSSADVGQCPEAGGCRRPESCGPAGVCYWRRLDALNRGLGVDDEQRRLIAKPSCFDGDACRYEQRGLAGCDGACALTQYDPEALAEFDEGRA